MGIEHGKTKSAAKYVLTPGPELDAKINEALTTIDRVVGATLGPNGRPVLIERYEYGLPPFVTKDGVTVFRSIALRGSAQHCVMEIARDGSSRTASEAGDGTTTAAILTNAIYQQFKKFCDTNPKVSPQRVVRHLEGVFRDHIEPTIKSLAVKADLETDEGKAFLRSVAQISANGDAALADAVMKCFDITGDEGNVTIVDGTGPSGYKTEAIDGYAIPGMGYEESCGNYYAKFINDPGNQRCVMEKPVFLLYNGEINEIQALAPILEKVGIGWIHGVPNEDAELKKFTHNVVVVANGFSDTVLGWLAACFANPETINVYPLVVPQSPQANGRLQFLMDVAAITGSRVLDILEAPLDMAELKDLGPGVDSFESYRFRSSIVGYANEDSLIERVMDLKLQLSHPESELDAVILRERAAKLAGGIAKLWVYGSSNAEIKEKRDRADDAICAVRGAIKNGTLPGGGWTLLKLIETMPHQEFVDAILRTAFMEPFNRLLSNGGIGEDEAVGVLASIVDNQALGKKVVYDFLEHQHVDAYEAGVLDSAPAVLEAIRNSLSTASQLGTLGGLVVFERDGEWEEQEARKTAKFVESLNRKA